MDNHGPDIFPRMLDFLLECEIDLAEFTVLTPFPGTPYFDEMKKSGRLLHEDFSHYNAEEVVIRPAKMTPEQLAAGYLAMWDGFYQDETQPEKMYRLYRRVTERSPFAKIGARERKPIPGQRAGDGALWGGVVEARREARRSNPTGE